MKPLLSTFSVTVQLIQACNFLLQDQNEMSRFVKGQNFATERVTWLSHGIMCPLYFLIQFVWLLAVSGNCCLQMRERVLTLSNDSFVHFCSNAFFAAIHN